MPDRPKKPRHVSCRTYSHIFMAASILSATTLVALPGCDHQTYFAGPQQLEIEAQAEAGTHPLFPVFVQLQHPLDFGAPSASELDRLQSGGDEPAAQDPWIRAQDLDITVQWRLENHSDAQITAWVMLDGATEFFDWNPIQIYGQGGGEEADEIPLPSLLGFYPRTIAAHEVVYGEFRDDDLREATFDLDVLTRFCGGPFALLHNRHEADSTGTEKVPENAQLAGMTSLRITLAATGAATLDYSIRVRDHNNVLFDGNQDNRHYETSPTVYVPAGIAAAVDDPLASENVGVSEFCGDSETQP